MTNAHQSPLLIQPLAWLVEFDQMVKPDVWEPVAHVVYELPEGHYLACATPITSQVELSKVLQRPGVTQLRLH
jgi:hypothetical protein